MEKSKPPTFSGQKIDYSEFKRGGNKAADIDWDDGNQVSTSTNQIQSQWRNLPYHQSLQYYG